MGKYYYHHRSQFQISAELAQKLKDDHGVSVAALLDEAGWNFDEDETGAITALGGNDDGEIGETDILETLAPYVADGSFIEDESDGDIRRHSFKAGRVEWEYARQESIFSPEMLRPSEAEAEIDDLHKRIAALEAVSPTRRYLVVYTHEYGADAYVVTAANLPSQEEVVRKLGLNFEPDTETIGILPLEGVPTPMNAA